MIVASATGETQGSPAYRYFEILKQSTSVLLAIGSLCLGAAAGLGSKVDRFLDSDFEDYNDPLASQD